MGAQCCTANSPYSNIVTINSKTVAGEWFGQQVLDIADLHNKELEFEVTIHHLKLRELAQSMNCFLEITIDDNNEYTFRTNESLKSNNVHWKNFEKNFRYSCVYEELQKKYMEVRLHHFDQREYQSKVVAIYRVDLYTLAIGPIHHSIELKDKTGRFLGKLSCDIVFSQITEVEVKLEEAHIKFYDIKEEAYKFNFNVITFQKTYESNMSSTKIIKVSQDHEHSFVNWSFEVGKQHLHLGEKKSIHVAQIVQQQHDANNKDLSESFQNQEPPYSTFSLSMDKVRYTSLKFKIWEDRYFKLERQKNYLSHLHLHHDSAQLLGRQMTLQPTNNRPKEELKRGYTQKIFQEVNVDDDLKEEQKKFFQSQGDATDYYGTSHHHQLKKMASKHIDENMDDYKSELIGECYIGFQKLLNEELKAFDIKDSMFFDTLKVGSLTNAGPSGKSGNGIQKLQSSIEGIQNNKEALQLQQQEFDNLRKASDTNLAIKGLIATQKKKQFTEKLWFCGQSVGEISGTLTFFNLPILYQMKVGVLSKKGISFTSKPILLDSQISNQRLLKDSDHHKRFVVLKDKLMLSDTGKVRQRLTYYDKMQLFSELSNLLTRSDKNSMTSFMYSNEQELLNAQRMLIELGLHCLEFSEFVDYDEREFYYQTLCQIFRRSELDLGQIGFSGETHNQIDKKSRDLFNKKVKVASQYQKFQYKALEMGIQKLNMKGVDVYKRSFVEIIISISFFRVPEFRERFLNIILEKSDGLIEEWRNTEGFILEKNQDENEFSSPAIMRMFDWKSFMYEHIPEEMQQQGLEILQRAIASDKWKLRIQKRGVAFFLIVKQWAIYVKNTLVSSNVNWKDIPGYKTILKAILLEMKERDVALYPEALKETTNALLYNEKILNIFVTIIFKKTHAFDSVAVNSALEIVASWFTTIHKNKTLIPPQFDYMFFFKAIQILMDLDHGMSTAKCIWLLYKILHVIPMSQRTTILKQILSSKKFYHYFFHWSFNVRMVFYYLYFFQFYQSLNKEQITEPQSENVNAYNTVRIGDRQFFGINSQSSKMNQGDDLPLIQLQHFQSATVGLDSNGANSESEQDKMSRLRQLVENKNAKGSLILAKSRLFLSDSNTSKIHKKFLKRRDEITHLVKFTDQIKDYIKQNKTELMKQKSENERKIFEMKVNYNPKLKDMLVKKGSYHSFSASYLTESDDDEITVPDERDWRIDVANLKKKVGDFNINNYIHVLSEEDQILYKKIILKVPQQSRVYMQYSLRKQFKKTRSEYEKWLEQNAKTEEELDLPDIAVKVPRDEAETNVVHDEW